MSNYDQLEERERVRADNANTIKVEVSDKDQLEMFGTEVETTCLVFTVCPLCNAHTRQVGYWQESLAQHLVMKHPEHFLSLNEGDFTTVHLAHEPSGVEITPKATESSMKFKPVRITFKIGSKIAEPADL